MKTIINIIMSFVLSGCCYLNPLFDDHKAFGDYMNSKIGTKPFGNIKESDVEKGYYKYNDDKSIVILTSSIMANGCQYDQYYDAKTSVFIGWKYLSDPQNCKRKKFHCGPW